MPRKVLIALPPGLLEEVDRIAGIEHRTRSDLIRESLRRYLNEFKRNHQPVQATLSAAPALVFPG